MPYNSGGGASTYHDGTNNDLAFNDSYHFRIRYYASWSDGTKLRLSDLHKIKNAVIAVAGAQKNIGEITKKEDKYRAILENYIACVKELHKMGMATSSDVEYLKKDLKSMKLTGLQTRERDNWPPGDHLWKKYEGIKRSLMNELFPKTQDKKEYPSGNGLKDMWNSAFMALFKKSNHYVRCRSDFISFYYCATDTSSLLLLWAEKTLSY